MTSGEIQAGFRTVQDQISNFLSDQDGVGYSEDCWDYAKGTGGGITRVWERASLIEKGGVNFSAIQGASLPASAATQFELPEGTPFLATGVSLVIHPWNPHIPTIHMNVRYFEAGDIWWFGGGVDLTPYYPDRKQVIAFHKGVRGVCEESGEEYPMHKQACDEYFFLKHRDEMRGIGGIFFDHLNTDKAKNLDFCLRLGRAFPELYRPCIEAGRDRAFTPEQREFQLYRRGRYVEFNLVYDRGTLFGLQSQGRTESILMSLPAEAHWKYDWHPKPGTPEAELAEVYLKPCDWANL